MTIAPFPFITDGIHGDVPTNFYPGADSERKVVLHPSPGLLSICTLPSCTEIRGIYNAWNDYLYVIAKRGSQSVLWRVDTSGAYAELGFFTTSASGPVWINNNRTQLSIVDGVTQYVYTPSSGQFVQVTSGNFPGSSTGDYQDGYGIFTQPNSNVWFFSALFDFKTYDSLDFYAKSRKPDNVLAIKSVNREPWVFGEKSTEVWYNAGGDNSSTDSPTFAPNTGGLIAQGLGAVGTPQEFDNSACWLSDKRQLLHSQGYIPRNIGTDMFGRAVNGMTKVDDAIAFNYVDYDHWFYQITFPSADQTWVYDAKTKTLFKRSSYKTGGFGRHRANCYAMLGSKHYVGDYENGKIYEMSQDYYDDDGHDMEHILYTKEVDNGLNRAFWPDVQLIIESGVGTSTLDPQIMMQWSGDSGNTWSSELSRGAGYIGQYTRRAIWRQMGSGFKRMYKFRMTDPVLWRILSIDFSGR